MKLPGTDCGDFVAGLDPDFVAELDADFVAELDTDFAAELDKDFVAPSSDWDDDDELMESLQACYLGTSCAPFVRPPPHGQR